MTHGYVVWNQLVDSTAVKALQTPYYTGTGGDAVPNRHVQRVRSLKRPTNSSHSRTKQLSSMLPCPGLFFTLSVVQASRSESRKARKVKVRRSTRQRKPSKPQRASNAQPRSISQSAAMHRPAVHDAVQPSLRKKPPKKDRPHASGS